MRMHSERGGRNYQAFQTVINKHLRLSRLSGDSIAIQCTLHTLARRRKNHKILRLIHVNTANEYEANWMCICRWYVMPFTPTRSINRRLASHHHKTESAIAAATEATSTTTINHACLSKHFVYTRVYAVSSCLFSIHLALFVWAHILHQHNICDYEICICKLFNRFDPNIGGSSK